LREAHGAPEGAFNVIDGRWRFVVVDEAGKQVAQFVHAEDAASFVGDCEDYQVRSQGGHLLWWEGMEQESAAESFDGAALVMFDRMARVAS
jgi:hypothetical protein